MMRIAYIELDTHAETAAQFFRLLDGSEDMHTTFFLSEKIFGQLQIHSPKIKIVKANQLKNHLHAGKFDLVILGTVHRHFNIFHDIVSAYHTAVLVHNKNFSRCSPNDLLWSVLKKDTPYRLKLLLKEGLLKAPGVYRKAHHLLVLDPNVADDTTKFFPLFSVKHFYVQKQTPLKIVVPGAVDTHRRDYSHILSKLAEFKLPATLVLLGKAPPEMLANLQAAQSRLPAYVSLKFFTEKVPEPLFREELCQADVLWCPIHRKTEFFSNPEFYGTTKMSGNVGDAVTFGQVAVVPTWYPTNLPFLIQEEEDVEAQFHFIKEARQTFAPQNFQDLQSFFQQNFYRDISEYQAAAVNEKAIALLREIAKT